MPNTEVKLTNAESTWPEAAREDRKLLIKERHPIRRVSFYMHKFEGSRTCEGSVPVVRQTVNFFFYDLSYLGKWASSVRLCWLHPYKEEGFLLTLLLHKVFIANRFYKRNSAGKNRVWVSPFIQKKGSEPFLRERSDTIKASKTPCLDKRSGKVWRRIEEVLNTKF